jgi:hypothetical protein
VKPSTLERLGGLALVAGAALFAAYSVLFFALLPIGLTPQDMARAVSHPAYVPLALVAFLGILLMMGGFAAVYARVREGSGLLGLVGFLVLELAYLLQAAKVTWEFAIFPVLVGDPAFAPLLARGILRSAPTVVPFRIAMAASIFVGIVLFCFVLIRSTAFPRAGGVLFFAGALLYGLGPMIGHYGSLSGVFTLATGCAVLGVRLVRRAEPHGSTDSLDAVGAVR